ncbi:FixH family protein [Pseudoalteromonas sp. SSM20]|uniref:FixH family protein n=1 Tax=Pseudoalteromonas sp. SSM20 TaxID=3139394 RepID=UPI003BAD646F
MSTTPWYKQFWPWFIIVIPAGTIVACITLLIYMSDKGPSMVVDDYYKKGKAINLELSKFNRSKALYLHADLEIHDGLVKVSFTKGDSLNPPALKTSFYHTTLKDKDVEVMLSPNANGDYSGVTELLEEGRYTVFIEPITGEWKLKENITLPYESAFIIKPEYK